MRVTKVVNYNEQMQVTVMHNPSDIPELVRHLRLTAKLNATMETMFCMVQNM